MFLVDITAGTLHPKPRRSDMNDLPLNLNLTINLSMTNAALGRYPDSSMKPKARNIMNMFGTKTRTPPTPPMIPSDIMEESQFSPKD